MFPTESWPHNAGVAAYDRTRKMLAKRVKERRAQLGQTQEAAAEKADLDVRHWQKLEAADLNVTLRTLCAVATALKSPVAELFAHHTSEKTSASRGRRRPL